MANVERYRKPRFQALARMWSKDRGLCAVAHYAPTPETTATIESDGAMWEDRFAEARAVLSDNIKRLRAEQGIAQERLGLESGVDRTIVSKIERRIANPSLEILVKIATRLDVSLAELLKEREG